MSSDCEMETLDIAGVCLAWLYYTHWPHAAQLEPE